MKSIVIYYSQTGNTKRIAEAIHSGMSQLAEKCDIAPLGVVDTRELLNYDLIGLGSPVPLPTIITNFINDMPSLKGRYGFTFCTHGTTPSDYIARMVAALRRKGLIITGWNNWFGSVFIPIVPKPYYTDGHPDEVDLKEAKDFGREIVERSRRISMGEARLIPRLPRKEKYDRLYGTPPPLGPEEEDTRRKLLGELGKLKPRLNVEKCRYPKCSICMDNCPTHSINMSESPPISDQTCQPCWLWFCEQLCPTGAIEVDWEPMDKLEDMLKSRFSRFAESLKTYKELRRLRSLVPFEEVGRDKPLYKIKKHPRLIIRDGVVELPR